MSHEGGSKLDADAKLVRMANQIGLFFQSKPPEQGAVGVAEHIRLFWEPRMRSRLLDLAEAGDQGLLPIVKAALPLVGATLADGKPR